MIIRLSWYKIRFETGADGDYLAHVTFFARASPVQKTLHELIILLQSEILTCQNVLLPNDPFLNC